MKTGRGRRQAMGRALVGALCALLLVFGVATQVVAAPFVNVQVDTNFGGLNPAGDGVFTPVNQFDMSANGSSMVIAGLAALNGAPSPGLVGLTVPVLYQSNMVAFVDPANTPFIAPKSNASAATPGAYEVTGVSALFAKVQSDVSVPLGGGTQARIITLVPVPGGTLHLFFDDYNAQPGLGSKSSVPTGSGFKDGHVVLAGGVDGGSIVITLTQNTPVPPGGITAGTGAANIDLKVSIGNCDPTFFQTAPGVVGCLTPAGGIGDLHFTGTLIFPQPAPGPPTTFFAGASANALIAALYPTTAVTGGDLVLKNDGNIQFTAAEPATLLLLGGGLLGLTGLGRFRRNKTKR